jgi:ribose transport system substrate-binding protein
MKKQWLLLTALCLTACVFVSCSHKEHEKKELIIAIIPKVDNVIFDQVKQSAFAAAKELGIVVTWEAPTSIDGEKQAELIENLIHYKVDGILISCNDAELLRVPINKAIKAGIKVGTFDSDCPKSSRTFYIGTDNEKAGKVCAETMLTLYEKAGKKPDQIVILSGGASAQNMTERLSGFRSIIDQKNIADLLVSFEIPDYGKELLTNNLNRNKKINGVQLFWGVPVLNGVDSIPALSKFIKQGGISVFFDVSKPLLRHIKGNPYCATMKQDFQSMGYDGVVNLYNAITEKPFNKKVLYDVIVIDQSNAEEEMQKL